MTSLLKHIAIGIIYYQGEGVTQDYIKAIEWFKKPANKKNEKAIRWLQSARRNIDRKNSFNNARNNSPKMLDIIILFGSLGAIILYIILVGLHGYFRKLSIAISPISLYLFVMYYEDWIQKGCTGECNIRIDIFITYPLLFGVVIVGLKNVVKVKEHE